MAISRFTGHHVRAPGSPEVFRTTGGALFGIGRGNKNAKLDVLHSRKNETANLDAVRQQHNEVVAHFDATRNDSIHITNNAPHIARLNDGWSQQTEPGFFERAIPQAVKAITGVWRLKEVP